MTLTMEQEQLVLDNTKLVHYFASRYFNDSMTHDDLAQEGLAGLIKASKKFDANLGYKFSTFAGKWVQGEILKSFRKPQVQTISLDEPIGYDTERMDYVPSGLSVEREVQLKLDIPQALAKLNERERNVVIHRFGLNGNEPLSQRKVGALLGLHQVVVSRAEKSALTKLRRFFGNW